MWEQFGTKDLYRIAIRATTNMKVGSRIIEPGEPILLMNSAQMMTLDQDSRVQAARGGHGNFSHVVWEKKGDPVLVIRDGVVSETGYALLTGLNTLTAPVEDPLYLTKTEVLETDSLGNIELAQTPSVDNPIFVFVYDGKTIREKISGFTVNGNTVSLGVGHGNTAVLVDYVFNYGEPATIYTLEYEALNAYVSFEAHYYNKLESGVNRTAILRMPKAKIVGNIELRVGDVVTGPTLSTFRITAMAGEGRDGVRSPMQILHLSSDIEGL